MPMTPLQALRRLEALHFEFGPDRAALKLGLLKRLERGWLGSSGSVLRLHEQLCFMRAYPDDRAVLVQVAGMLKDFSRRADLRRHRLALDDSGIAGTRIRYRFFWNTALWLASRWPAQLQIDWDAVEDPDRLAAALPLLVTPVEAAWLRERRPPVRAAMARFCHGGQAQGTFLIKRIEAMSGNDFTREAFADALDTALFIDPAPGTPSRTLAWHPRSAVAFASAPLRRSRPELRAELERPPRAVRAASAAEGAQLIDLAHAALVTRSRDLDGITFGNRHDVWVVDDGHGLQWAFIGIVPERRQLLRASYGFVTLRSGVPIGYGQMDTLFRCADVSFNTFDTFRGAETAWIFVRLLAATKALFGACTFTLEGYQLGHHNEEGIASGAWWFYFKLGFRPRDPETRKLANEELARMQANPGYRTPAATLRRLAADTMVYETQGVRAANWPQLSDLGAISAARLAVAGIDREAALKEYSRLAMRRLGIKSLVELDGNRTDVQLAWDRWAPIVDLLPVSSWKMPERRALARIIAAKGGVSEREFLLQFDAHPRLAAALRSLTRA